MVLVGGIRRLNEDTGNHFRHKFEKETKMRKGRGGFNMSKNFGAFCQGIQYCCHFFFDNPLLDIFFPFPCSMEEVHVRILSHSTGSSPHHPSWICTRTLYFFIYPLISQRMSHFLFSSSSAKVSYLPPEFLKWDFLQQLKLNLFRQTLRQSRHSTKLKMVER